VIGRNFGSSSEERRGNHTSKERAVRAEFIPQSKSLDSSAKKRAIKRLMI